MQKIAMLQNTWWEGQLADIWHCTASLFLLSFWSGLRADNMVLTTNHNVYDQERHINISCLRESKDSIQGSLLKKNGRKARRKTQS